MKALRFFVCAALFAGVTGASTMVFAAPPKPIREELQGDAQKRFDDGMDAVRASQWVPARDGFLKAWELSRNPRVLFNVAVAEKNLTHYDKAIYYFNMELREGKGSLGAEEEARVQQNIEALKKYTGMMRLEVTEPGATVLIDDEEVGKTPIEPRLVAVNRLITIKKAGFETYTKRLDDVADGKLFELKVKLESINRTTDVEVRVAGVQSAAVYIDGSEVGFASAVTPYRGKVSVRPEPHSFEARATGFVSGSESRIAVEGQTLQLNFSLAKQQDTGLLSVNVTPKGSIIEIDGKPQGADQWRGPVSAGAHTLKFSKEGFYTRTREVNVVAGETRRVIETLDENKSTSWLGWAIGTTLIVAGATVATIFLSLPRTDPIPGSLRVDEGKPVDTAAFRFR